MSGVRNGHPSATVTPQPAASTGKALNGHSLEGDERLCTAARNNVHHREVTEEMQIATTGTGRRAPKGTADARRTGTAGVGEDADPPFSRSARGHVRWHNPLRKQSGIDLKSSTQTRHGKRPRHNQASTRENRQRATQTLHLVCERSSRLCWPRPQRGNRPNLLQGVQTYTCHCAFTARNPTARRRDGPWTQATRSERSHIEHTRHELLGAHTARGDGVQGRAPRGQRGWAGAGGREPRGTGILGRDGRVHGPTTVMMHGQKHAP